MTLALVTGATGFVGAHVVRALLAEGVDVRALARPGGDRRNLEGLRVEVVESDLREEAGLEGAMAGVEALFHVAAVYSLARADREAVFAANVQGTCRLMEAALRAGVARVVHTSSVAAVGFQHADGRPADERDWTPVGALAGAYEESKYLSERLVQALVQREGLPAVVVNPTAPIGPLDVKPTPTGRMIADAANGSLPAYVRGAGMNMVHVRDVARGHVLAWQQGEVGERYILGHCEGNLSLREVFEKAAEAALSSRPTAESQGARAWGRGRGLGWRVGRWRLPLVGIPWQAAMAYAQVDERISGWRGRAVRAPVAGVRLARRRMWFDCSKAVRELGMPQSPLEEAFAEAVAYFRSVRLVQE